MSEAPDTGSDDFDSEFEAARAAEREAPETEVETQDAAEGEGDEIDTPEKTPAELRAEAAEKRLQDTQKAMKAERRKRQELEKRFEALERRAPAAKDTPPTPEALLAALRDDDDDPIGDIQTVKQLARLLVGQTAEDTAAEAQAKQRASALQTVSTTMKDYEDDFRELNPDYDKAAKHFMDARMEELRDTGLDGQDLVTAMQNDFAGIVSRSVAAGKDPAEIIYNMAQRRGFKLEGAATKLETVERGQAHAKSLTGGGSPQGALSAGKIADLKGAAFDAAFEKLRASERRRG